MSEQSTRVDIDLAQRLCQLLHILLQLLIMLLDCRCFNPVHLLHTVRCYLVKPCAGLENCPPAACRPAEPLSRKLVSLAVWTGITGPQVCICSWTQNTTHFDDMQYLYATYTMLTPVFSQQQLQYNLCTCKQPDVHAVLHVQTHTCQRWSIGPCRQVPDPVY